MKINKDITSLILETIPKFYRYENDFYKKEGIKFPDNNPYNTVTLRNQYQGVQKRKH